MVKLQSKFLFTKDSDNICGWLIISSKFISKPELVKGT